MLGVSSLGRRGAGSAMGVLPTPPTWSSGGFNLMTPVTPSQTVLSSFRFLHRALECSGFVGMHVVQKAGSRTNANPDLSVSAGICPCSQISSGNYVPAQGLGQICPCGETLGAQRFWPFQKAAGTPRLGRWVSWEVFHGSGKGTGRGVKGLEGFMALYILGKN